jgi:hypothetical protein
VDSELDEGARVDQQRQPLARGELVLLVLAGDFLFAAAELDVLTALVEVVDERTKRRPRDQLIRRRGAPGASAPAALLIRCCGARRASAPAALLAAAYGIWPASR